MNNMEFDDTSVGNLIECFWDIYHFLNRSYDITKRISSDAECDEALYFTDKAIVSMYGFLKPLIEETLDPRSRIMNTVDTEILSSPKPFSDYSFIKRKFEECFKINKQYEVPIKAPSIIYPFCLYTIYEQIKQNPQKELHKIIDKNVNKLPSLAYKSDNYISDKILRVFEFLNSIKDCKSVYSSLNLFLFNKYYFYTDLVTMAYCGIASTHFLDKGKTLIKREASQKDDIMKDLILERQSLHLKLIYMKRFSEILSPIDLQKMTRNTAMAEEWKELIGSFDKAFDIIDDIYAEKQAQPFDFIKGELDKWKSNNLLDSYIHMIYAMDKSEISAKKRIRLYYEDIRPIYGRPNTPFPTFP